MTDLSLYRRALARVAGLRFNKMPHGPDEVEPGLWEPDIDVAQAIQVLEVVSEKENVAARLSLGHRWGCTIDGGCRLWAEKLAPTLPLAICLVIIEVLDLKPEEE